MQAALNAGTTAGRSLKVYAVEKNPNAVITLRNRAIMDGWDNVTIVAKDMRQWVRVLRLYRCRSLSVRRTKRSSVRGKRRELGTQSYNKMRHMAHYCEPSSPILI